MNTTNDYLNAVKAKTGAPSDYALAKKLELTRSAISKYRNLNTGFDNLTALKVASILEIDPMIVISSVSLEKAKTPTEKQLWKTVFERLGGVAASVIIASTLLVNPAPAKAASDFTSRNNVYYVKFYDG